MRFSLSDYQAGLASGLYDPPAAFRPFMYVNHRQYRVLEQRHVNSGNDVPRAFRSLRQRVSEEHFRTTYPVQTRTLEFSRNSFPAYRFILPEVLAADWLAIVDWHKSQRRDHVLHQPLTAYIVLKLLKGGDGADQGLLMPSGLSLWDECVNEILNGNGTEYLRGFVRATGVSDKWLKDDAIGRALWKALFIEAAYLAAVFHDMGYPWQYVKTLSMSLEHAAYPHDSSKVDAARVVEHFGERLLFYPLNGYRSQTRSSPATWRQRLVDITAKGLCATHGLPGAIGFLYLNDVLREYPEVSPHPIRQFCVEWAAMAIMMHDMPKIYWGENLTTPPDNGHMRLRLPIDPLSWVVALADVLQDFSRPLAVFNKHSGNDTAVAVGYESACDSVELEVVTDPSPTTLKIVYRMKTPVEMARKLDSIVKERSRYFHQQHGYLDVSGAGIVKVEMDARLVQ